MMSKFFTLFLFVLTTGSYPQSLVNTSHLDHLYENVVVDDDTMGIIHIYADYPDYNWVGDEDEGVACIDDAARAMIFYLKYHQLTGDQPALDKVKKLLNFIFYMHADNGFFYNFIWKDNSINREFRTSQAIANWWSWRALWALAEAGSFFKEKDQGLNLTINRHIDKLLKASHSFLDTKEVYKDFSGFRLPAWLPYESASDQAALIVKSLSIYFETERDSSVIPLIKKLSEGIKGMQAGNKDEPPYYAFLSWQNTWHAWGNSQAEALIHAGKILNDSTLINAALNEINYFYPYLIDKVYLSEFSVGKKGQQTEFTKMSAFPQIAYGFSPLILNSAAAYELTGDNKYLDIAAAVGCWFLSCNLADIKMYSKATGVCFDGLSEGKVNKNSGAESTIEALLSFLKIESIPGLKEELYNKVNND